MDRTHVVTYISLFSLSKLVCLTLKVSRETFYGIISPWVDENAVVGIIEQVKQSLPIILNTHYLL